MSETVFDRINLIERYATKQEKVIIEFIRNNPIRDMTLRSITEFSNKVLRYGINCFYREDSHFQLITSSLLTKEDVMILFSVSGGIRYAVEHYRKGSGLLPHDYVTGWRNREGDDYDRLLLTHSGTAEIAFLLCME